LVLVLKLFVISLKSVISRRAKATAQLNAKKIPFKFFDAVEGDSTAQLTVGGVNHWLFRLNTLREALPEEIGCYASHRMLWERCVDLNEPIVVLEDDFELSPSFSQAIKELDPLMDSFGFIRLESKNRKRALGKRLRPRAYAVHSLRDRRLEYLSDPPQSMTAYAISPKAAASLLAASKPLTAPVDKFIQRTWEHSTPLFVLEPAVVGLSDENLNSTINSSGSRSTKSRNLFILASRMIYKGYGELQRIRFDRKQLRHFGLSVFS